MRGLPLAKDGEGPPNSAEGGASYQYAHHSSPGAIAGLQQSLENVLNFLVCEYVICLNGGSV